MPVMDLLDSAQMSAVWEMLNLQQRAKLATEAAGEWVDSFPTEKKFHFAVHTGWFLLPTRVRQLIVFYLNARATVIQYDYAPVIEAQKRAKARS